MRRLGLTVVIAIAMAAPATASAATFCVQAPSCTGTPAADLQAALGAANLASGRDRIEIGAGTLTPAQVNPSTFEALDVAGNPVDIVGAGRTQTTVQRSGSGSSLFALYLDEPTSTVQDLQVELPSSASKEGIFLNGATAQRIGITSGATALTGYIGVQMSGAATLADSVISMPDTFVSYGAWAQLTTSGATISGTTFTGAYGVSQNQGTLAVRDARVTVTAAGMQVYGTGTMDVQDSTIHFIPAASPPSGAAALSSTNSGASGTTTLTARHVTVVGNGTAGSVAIYTDASGSGRTATLTLADSIIRDVGHAILSQGDSTATSSVSTNYSDYNNAGNLTAGGGAAPAEAHRVNVDPLFADAAGGNYRLAPASPVVDAGTPGALGIGELSADLAGNPRILDGNGDCAARRDMGAFEYSPSVLVAAAAASADNAQTGTPLTFTGSSSCDPDPAAAVSYAWSFDDGTTAGGASVPKAFATAGAHTATLTVSDAAGRTGSATKTVTVTAPAPVPPQGGSASDTTAPVLTLLKLTPKAFAAGKAGTTVAYTLSEAASTTFTVQRALPGIRKGRRCVKARSGRRGGKRCTRFLRVPGSFANAGTTGANHFHFTGSIGGRPLRRGAYRLAASPRDAAGNVGHTVRLRFRIIAGF